jgi:hypothetical protein
MSDPDNTLSDAEGVTTEAQAGNTLIGGVLEKQHDNISSTSTITAGMSGPPASNLSPELGVKSADDTKNADGSPSPPPPSAAAFTALNPSPELAVDSTNKNNTLKRSRALVEEAGELLDEIDPKKGKGGGQRTKHKKNTKKSHRQSKSSKKVAKRRKSSKKSRRRSSKKSRK